MDLNLNFEISIPTDSDGFVLLRCPLCGEFFKLTPADIKADDVLEIWCPFCGLKSENYFTEEILDLAMRMAKNRIEDNLHKKLKSMEQATRGKGVFFKVTSKSIKEYEYPILPLIDILGVQNYKCCHRQAKITPSLKLTGSYCPFCGVNYDEN